MDRAPLTTDASKAASWCDLEDAIIDSRASASLVEMTLESILSNDTHPTVKAPNGSRVLLLNETTIEALNYALGELVVSTRKAADVFETVYQARKDRA